MPHHPNDDRHPHLQLFVESENPSRRKPEGFAGQLPDRGGRQSFASQLASSSQQLEKEAQGRQPVAPGIQKHLVFRIPIATKEPGALANLLPNVGINLVAIESDGAIVAFNDDADLSLFREAVETYRRGPKTNLKTGKLQKTTQWDVLQLIEPEKMAHWSPTDRIGGRLAKEIGSDGSKIDPLKLYVLDVELWHPGSVQLGKRSIQELRKAIEFEARENERIRDEFTGELLCLARISVCGAKLQKLLELDAIAEIELPPIAIFDAIRAKQVTPREFPTPPPPIPEGPRVCILDSGITSNHPLLRNNIGHAEAILTDSDSPSDDVGHGTMVAGIAVFGNVRASYERGQFESAVTLFSARVTNEHNRFDDDKLILNQMREAIRFFHKEPYECRVFNLSLGQDFAWLKENSRQAEWAECLDTLARELNVLLVISAGNHNLAEGNNPHDAEAALTNYPKYLRHPDAGLCDPATAAIPITVGGIVEHDIHAVRRGRQQNDLSRPIAAIGQPSPLTRVGPGLQGAMKPEFVAAAGNLSFDGFGEARSIRGVEGVDGENAADPGLAVMSFSNAPTEQLFRFGIGTSYAAPQVARIAALVWQELRHVLREEPHPNLVRAILASAATVPDQSRELIETTFTEEKDKDAVRHICGYGMIDEELAMQSSDRRVALLAQTTIPIDSFRIFSVPVPDEFRGAEGKKRVVVSMAFDPPVRRRRREYFGVEMNLALIRGKSIEEIIAAYGALTSDERKAKKAKTQKFPGAIQGACKCDLKPTSSTLSTSTLWRSEWSFERETKDYGDTWYLLVWAKRTWAPSEFVEQNVGVVVTMEASEPQLYQLVQQRIQQKISLRQRSRG